MELHEKIDGIKAKVLHTLRCRIDGASLKELKQIAEILKILADDSNLYLKMLAELSGKGMALGKKEETPTAEKHYRYKKTGEVYNGQIYVNGECCTDGNGNEIIYS